MYFGTLYMIKSPVFVFANTPHSTILRSHVRTNYSEIYYTGTYVKNVHQPVITTRMPDFLQYSDVCRFFFFCSSNYSLQRHSHLPRGLRLAVGSAVLPRGDYLQGRSLSHRLGVYTGDNGIGTVRLLSVSVPIRHHKGGQGLRHGVVICNVFFVFGFANVVCLAVHSYVFINETVMGKRVFR